MIQKKVMRVIERYDEIIGIRKDSSKVLQSRLLFSGLRYLVKKMMKEGRVILSYKLNKVNDWVISNKEWDKECDKEWDEYRLCAWTLYIGKRVKEAKFRHILRERHCNTSRVIYTG